MTDSFDARCSLVGLRVTSARRLVYKVLAESLDHPDAELLHRRVHKRCPKIGMATVYRTLRLFEDKGLVAKRDFGDDRARYECASPERHDHLIDADSGAILEFFEPEVERLCAKIARRHGLVLRGHKLELYAARAGKKARNPSRI